MFYKKKNGSFLSTQSFPEVACSGKYILDDQNVVIVYENPYKEDGNLYIMVHYRVEDGKIFEVNRWDQKCFYGVYPKVEIIKNLNLFMVQGGKNPFLEYSLGHHALYNYKMGKFVIKSGVWDFLAYQNNAMGELNYLESYKCFIGCFQLHSTINANKETSLHSITKEEKMCSSGVEDKIHFAILDIDGKVRDNRLFIGNDLFHIEEIIDLNAFSSMEEYKRQRINLLNEKKEQQEQRFYQSLNQNGVYVENCPDEVMKTLKKSYKK